MGSIKELLQWMTKGGADPDEVKVKGMTTKTSDMDPEVLAEIEAEEDKPLKFPLKTNVEAAVKEAIRTSPPEVRALMESSAMATVMQDMLFTILTGPKAKPEDYPVGDPKGGPELPKIDWNASKLRTPGTVMSENTLMNGLSALKGPKKSALELAVEASQAEETENKKKLSSGAGSLDNRAFLALVGAAQAVIQEAMAGPRFDKPSGHTAKAEEKDMDPLKDPLPQFLRPDTALRKLPDNSIGQRASLTFIRQVIELLRDTFPDVKDKYWLLNEVPVSDMAILVTVVVRVNANRDVVISIQPSQSECMVRTEDADVVLEQTTLENANWPDFVGWVSLAKGLTKS